MQKFTVFTVILTILVVVVSAETFANKYLPSLTKADITSPGSTDQLTLPKELNLATEDNTKILSGTDSTTSTGVTDLNSGLLGIENVETGITNSTEIPTKEPLTTNTSVTSTPTSESFDIESFSSEESTALNSSLNSSLNDTMILNSGFIGAHMETEDNDGTLYKTIDLTDLKGIKVEKYNVTDDTNTFAKIYIISFDGTTILDDTYNVLKLRASQILDAQINETNEFGLGSFYMNDVRRSGVAFLTVKISDKIYGFTYPKQYHPQVKNLVSLLALGNIQLQN